MAARFWVGGTGVWSSANTANWSATSGGVGGATVPTSIDYATFNSSSGGGVVTLGFDAPTQGLDIRTFAGTLAFSIYKITCAGNAQTILRQDATSTVTGSKLVQLTYSGAVGTRTTGMLATLEINALNVSVTGGADVIAGSTSEIFNDLDFTGFSGTFSVRARTIYGNLTISTGMTVGGGGTTETMTFAKTSGVQQITTNGKTFDFRLAFNGVGTTFVFQDAITQNSTRDFTFTNGTLQLKNNATSTVGNFITTGTNQKFLQSTVSGSQATLSEVSGIVNATRLTVQDINATGGATWNAYLNQNNVDAGNNDGWDFSLSPVVRGYELAYQLRSFTQPRRF